MHPRLLAVPLMLTLGVAACGGSQPAPPPAQDQSAAPAAPAVDPASAATVAGKVTLDGALPANQPIRMNADPACVAANKGQNPTQETFVGDGGSLGNVFVYVNGVAGSFPAPTTPVVLDQKGCRYVPHVFGVQVGQPIEIVNSDPTLHNVHATPKANAEFNTAQPIQGMKTTHTFTAKEPDVVVPFKCDVHGWMNSSAGVLDHPYFAVTKADGSFSIPNLPPGTYTLTAWHERLGKQEQSITVAAKESKADANFTFKAAAGAN